MRIFHKKDGGIVQLIEKEKMMEWPVELPLLFISYIRDKQIDSYEDATVKKEVENYLEEVTKDVAIPRLLSVLEGDNSDEIILALTRIEEIAKKKLDMVRPIKPYLENLMRNKNKDIVKLTQNISNIFTSADRKKELAAKRKVMQQKEKDFLAGKVNANDYAKARKDYLTLKE